MTVPAVYNVGDASRDRTLKAEQIITVLIRRWWIIALCAIALGGLGLVGAGLLPPQYSATGDLVVDSRPFAIPELQGAISGEMSPDLLPSVRTDAIELKAASLMERVARELRLDEQPSFNTGLAEPGLLSSISAWTRRLLGLPEPASVRPYDATVAFAADTLAKRLNVFYDNRSFVINVSIALPDGELAASVVNTVLHEYLAARVSARLEENAAANATLTHRAEEVQRKITELDTTLAELRATNGLVQLPSGGLPQQHLAELETAYNRAAEDRVRAEAALQQAGSVAESGDASNLTDVLASPTIARLREREVVAAEALASASSSVGPSHPARLRAEGNLRQVKAEIGKEVARVARSLRAQVAAARAREDAAKTAMTQASADAGKASLVQARVSQLEKESAGWRALYQTLLERVAQTAPQPELAKRSPGIHIGSAAVVPEVSSGPQPKVVGLLGALAGGALGSLIALTVRARKPFFREIGEIGELPDAPLLAVIPADEDDDEFADADIMPSRYEDALSSLRLRLRQRGLAGGADIRSVAFLGAVDEDTKTIARAFARTAARGGEKVLLLEIAARSPVSPAASGAAEANFIDENVSWRDLLVRDRRSPLMVLTAVGQYVHATDTKAAVRLRSLFHEAADDFNLIVASSPHAGESGQADALVQVANAVLLVVDIDASRRSRVMRRIDYFRSISARIGLVVLARKGFERRYARSAS